LAANSLAVLHFRTRIIEEVKVARTLEFKDGTQIALGLAAPELDQKGMIDGDLYPCGKEAAEFLCKLIGDRPVMAIRDELPGCCWWKWIRAGKWTRSTDFSSAPGTS
jgi:hypothetical protein